jgi:hypothetical protein
MSVRRAIIVCASLCHCQFIHPSVWLPSILCLHPYICLSVYLSICLFFCPSIRLSVYPSVCLSTHLLVCPSVCFSTLTYVCLSIRLFVHLSLCLFSCPSICLSVNCFCPHFNYLSKKFWNSNEPEDFLMQIKIWLKASKSIIVALEATVRGCLVNLTFDRVSICPINKEKISIFLGPT